MATNKQHKTVEEIKLEVYEAGLDGELAKYAIARGDAALATQYARCAARAILYYMPEHTWAAV